MKVLSSNSSPSFSKALIANFFILKSNRNFKILVLLVAIAAAAMLVSGVVSAGRSDAANSRTEAASSRPGETETLIRPRKLISRSTAASNLATNLPLSPLPPANLYVDGGGVCGGNAPCFTTIQAAINAANPGDTINVFAGAYVEEITINKALTLLGPNAGINPNTGTRVAEAVIEPTFSDPINSGFNGPQLVTLAADGVSFNGFTLDGDNPNLTSGVSYNGADVDAEFGIYGTGNSANPDAVITNNIVKNIGELCIWIDAGNVGAPKDSVSQIADNKVDNCFGAFGQGIRIDNGAWVSILNNVVTRLRVGIVIENYTGAGTPSTHPPSVVGNNNVTSFRFGIRQNLHQAYDPPGFTISNNTVSSYVQAVRPSQVTAIEPAVTSYQGIRLDSIRGTDFVTVSGNTVIGNQAALTAAGYTRVEGLYVTNAASTSPNISFDHNDVRDFIRGAFNDSPVVPTFTCNIFQANGTGLYNSSDGNPTGSLVVNNNNIVGNGFGLQNDGTTMVDAKQNWWGAANGPGPVGPGSGNNVSSNVDFSNFLTSPASCAPKADQQITFGALAGKTFGDADFTVSATASSGLAVSFSAMGNCTVSGNLVHLTGAGSCAVTASQGGDSNYNPAPNVTQSFNIAKANQTITVGTHAPANAAFNTSFIVAATSNSGLAVSYSSAGVCTNVGATFTMTASTGTCTVKYDQAGDTNFNAAAQVTESVTAQKANQTITVNTHAPATANYNTSFTVAATSSSGLAVSFSSAGVCTNVGATFTMTSGTGTCTVKYDQAGDANFNAAAQVTESVTAQKANQTITVNTHAPATAAYNTSFTVAATSNSSLAVSFSSAGVCTNVGATFTMTSGTGTCTVKYDQAGDANYNAATQVTESVTAQKATQTITVNTHAPANATYNTNFTVAATSNSSLAVAYSSAGVCTNVGATFTMTSGTGTCTVKYDQAGDTNFNAATQVTESVTAQKVATTTTLSASVNPSDSGQSVTFTATVAATAGTPTGTVQFTDGAGNLGAAMNCVAAVGNTCTAQVSTSTLTAGTHTISATYSGDANFQTSTGTLSGGQVVRPQPSLSINDVSLAEGDSGTRNFNFTVTLSAASNLTVKVDFATANGTATQADNDYQAASGTLTFNPGDLTKSITILVNGDQKFEPDETFFVNLSNPVNGTISDNQGLGTILNDDAQGGIISFSQANYSVNENAGIVIVTVNRTADTSAAATVDYATDDTGAPVPCGTLNSGLASSRCDFDAVFGTLRFAPTETQKTIAIAINQDAYAEGAEVFRVNLSNLTGGAVLATPSSATVTINDSASPAANAIDDTTTFVRQQYRDFLNREPDMPGLVFWRNNIDQCNDPANRAPGQTLAQCIEVMRINTSAAFFLSIEFQNSGLLVRSFYVAALNRPATNNMPAFVEFERDSQAVARGVIVDPNNNAWQTVLANNRTAFMNDFVMRAEFVGLYPTTDTPTQYVDKLYAHAGVSPGTAQERTDAIGEFGAAPTAADPGARGRALLRITQNTAFQQREVNRAFVQMQYFGYLRRNPNDAPDSDFSGYNFWLNKLNAAGGNFIQAEMVESFLRSSEYRQRFGP